MSHDLQLLDGFLIRLNRLCKVVDDLFSLLEQYRAVSFKDDPVAEHDEYEVISLRYQNIAAGFLRHLLQILIEAVKILVNLFSVCALV